MCVFAYEHRAQLSVSVVVTSDSLAVWVGVTSQLKLESQFLTEAKKDLLQPVFIVEHHVKNILLIHNILSNAILIQFCTFLASINL